MPRSDALGEVKDRRATRAGLHRCPGHPSSMPSTDSGTAAAYVLAACRRVPAGRGRAGAPVDRQPAGENPSITRRRGEPGRCRVDTGGGGEAGRSGSVPARDRPIHRVVHKFSPAGQGRLYPVKFFGIISLFESPRGYPRRHPHSTVDAAVRLPYRKEEIRDRPQTDPLPVWGSPRRLEGNSKADRPTPRRARCPPAMDRQGLRPRWTPSEIGAGGRGLGRPRRENEDESDARAAAVVCPIRGEDRVMPATRTGVATIGPT